MKQLSFLRYACRGKHAHFETVLVKEKSGTEIAAR